MRVIELNAGAWASIDDFMAAILSALDAPAWHGRDLNALLDSAIPGQINGVEPPYTVRILGAAGLPEPVRDYVAALAAHVAERRERQLRQTGEDFQVFYEGDLGAPRPQS